MKTENDKENVSVENKAPVAQSPVEKSTKERIAELKQLLKWCNELGEKEKALVIEKEIKMLEEKEK